MSGRRFGISCWDAGEFFIAFPDAYQLWHLSPINAGRALHLIVKNKNNPN